MSREWDNIQTEYLLRLFKEYGIETIFETGTFEGDTSLRFYDLGFKVYTVENNWDRYQFCKHKFGNTNIELYGEDSVASLGEFVKRNIRDVFYYLDAHERGKEPPLKRELQILFTLPKFLVMIHDIEVKNCPQFTFGNDVTSVFYSIEIPKDIVQIYPKYVTQPNEYLKSRTIGYCILSRGYPIIKDERFSYLGGDSC